MSNQDRIPEAFKALKPHISKILNDEELSSMPVNIACRTLTPEEALGNPSRDDFPLQKGKEKLMQAEIGSSKGQAFTDRPGNFDATLEEILKLTPDNNFNRAAIIAALNAVLRGGNIVGRTIHCKDDGPRLCSSELVEKISSSYGKPKITMVGLQPAMAEALSANFTLRIVDLDQQNNGKRFNDTVVETGAYPVSELEEWSDLFLVTGSTIVNGTIDQFLHLETPVLFFGTTIAGPAKLLGLKHFCPRGT